MAQAGGPYFAVRSGGMWGYIDRGGRTIHTPVYDFAYRFADGLGLIRVDSRYGYLDELFHQVIPPQYPKAEPFSEGRAVVEVERNGEHVPCAIDKRGSIVVWPRGYQWISDCHEGYMVFEHAGARGFMDKDGREIVPATFQTLGCFSCGLARAGTQTDRGFVDYAGHFVIPPIYRATWSFSEGLAAFQQSDCLIGFLNQHGEVVITPRGIERLSVFSQGRCAVQTTKGWGIIDSTGRFVREPDPGIIEIGPFSEGLAGFRTPPRGSDDEGLIGYVGLDGDIVIPSTFMDGEPFRDGLAFITDADGARAYIDQSGKFVWREDCG